MTARTDANARLEDARAFLEAAGTIDTLNDAESYADVIATLAVHAGIAASDASCLLMLALQVGKPRRRCQRAEEGRRGQRHLESPAG